jgi:hypothetical protein
MLRRLGYLVRGDELRGTVVAFAFNAMFVGSHAVLETARDALFLSKVPGSRLPIVYAIIALVSFALSRAQRAFARLERTRELAAWVAVASVGTALLGFSQPWMGDAGLYVLYVWAGVIASLVLVHFWSLLGDMFTATQAKRLYGVITLGSMGGAIAGNAIVTTAASFVSGQTLVYLAAAGFASTLVPASFLRALDRAEPEPEVPAAEIGASFAYAARAPYVAQLLLLNLAAAFALTVADFTFKSTIVANVPVDRLASTLGQYYLALNVASLVMQLVAVSFLMRRLPPPLMVAILPIGLALGGVGLAVSGTLAAAIVIKGADGTLRYSLHKTGLELLLVPLTEAQRRKAKALLELLGQRGGQIVASVAIAVATAIGLSSDALGWVLAASAILWAVSAIRLQPRYVDQFRASIALRAAPRSEGAPKLDVASLETLVAALDSAAKVEVLAALRVLESEGKTRLIPALILYHPDEDVVVAALRIFGRVGKRGALAAIDRLLDRASTRVRAEAAAARVAIDPDPGPLARRLESEEAVPVRAAISVAMATSGVIDQALLKRGLEGFFLHADDATKVVVAEIVGSKRAVAMEEIVERLSHAEQPEEVRLAAVAALGELGTMTAAHTLVDLLRFEPLQRAVRTALWRSGEAGFTALLEALSDSKRASTIRWAVPRALCACDPSRSAPHLLANLSRETDGMVRYRTIVTLHEILERDPRLRLDREIIDEELRLTVSRAYRYLARRIVLERGATEDARRKTTGHELLVGILADKERLAIGRIYRLLGLAFPKHRFGDIYRSIESSRKAHRATAVELTRGLLREPLRDAVSGLVEDLDDDARLASAGDFAPQVPESYDELLLGLLTSTSSVVRDIAAFHVTELRLEGAEPALVAARASGGSADVERALDVLRGGAPSLRDIGFVMGPPGAIRAG